MIDLSRPYTRWARCLPPLLLFIGCTTSAMVAAQTVPATASFRTIKFSAKVRPNLEPVSPQEAASAPVLFSDSIADQNAPISGLLPVVADARDIAGLGFAPVLWVPGGTAIRLSYETIATEPRFNGRIPGLTAGPWLDTIGSQPEDARELTINARGINDPSTRRFLVLRDLNPPVVLDRNLFQGGFFPNDLGATVGLERCATIPVPITAGDDPPASSRVSCIRAPITPATCNGTPRSNSTFSFTLIDCRLRDVPFRDTQYRLTAAYSLNPAISIPTAFPGSTVEPKVLGQIKVVAGERILRRGASRAPEQCLVPDGTAGTAPCSDAQLERLRIWRFCAGRLVLRPGEVPPNVTCPRYSVPPEGYRSVTGNWTFTVADPRTGRFTETFLPSVPVWRVKVRITNSAGAVRYLNANEITEMRVVVPNRNNEVACTITAEPGTGHASVDVSVCDSSNFAPVTVAWVGNDKASPVTWKLVIRIDAKPRLVIGKDCDPLGRCRELVATNALANDLPIRSDDKVEFEFKVRRVGFPPV